MELILTSDEMMDQWRLRRGVEPLRADSSVTRTYGSDFDALLRAELDNWYARLLDTAPRQLLAPENVASEGSLTPTGTHSHGAQLTLPVHVRRVLTVRLEGWNVPSAPIALADSATMLRRQANPFTAATTACPLVIDIGSSFMLFPASADSVIASIEAVTDRSPDEYRLDSRALELITPDTQMLI